MKRLIAIVEDEAAIRDNYAAAFTREGYAVRCYANRAQAMAAFAQRLPDLAVIKTRQQAAWSSGDYAIVGTTLQIVGEELCVVVEPFKDKRVGFRPARRRYGFLVHNRASNLWIAFLAGRLVERQINFRKRFA